MQLQTNPGAYTAGLTTVAQQAAMAKAALDAVTRASLQVHPAGSSFVGPLQHDLGQTAKAIEQVTKAQDGPGKSSAAVVTATAATTTATKALGISAAQTANAMRMLPAQLTDITVGLSTGQSPFMVLMQQGGQLKDMFGGIGPAVRAMGGYLLGLIGPISVMAAAVGILTLAWVKGDAEVRKFNEAIVTTGNYAGVTADSLSGMARSISGSVGTTGKAADTLTKLVETGRLAGDTIKGLG
ncbi:MAG: phage tail length tape measure family protein, partial [Pseudomonas sp.]